MKFSVLFLGLALTAAAAVSPEALVSEIAAANPELQFYRDEIAAVRAIGRLATSRAAPELSVEAGRKRVRRSIADVGDGAVWSVSVAQTFEWPGRLALRKSIANAELELAELGLARFESALRARAHTLALGLAGAEIQASSAREVADRFAALKRVFLARDPAGLTPLLETRVIEAQEIALQRRAASAELAVYSARAELNQLRGQPADTPLEIAPTALQFNPAPDPAALLAAAREKNFEFRAKRLELEQQGYAVQMARTDDRPSFTVSPFVSQENAGERETVAGLGLSLPLPSAGRTHAAAAAKARQRQAESAVRVAEQELARSILEAAARFAVRRAEHARCSGEGVERFREAAALADRHYRLGAVPLATYVELQQAYLDAVEALLETEREALEAGLQLQLLTGLDFHAVEARP